MDQSDFQGSPDPGSSAGPAGAGGSRPGGGVFPATRWSLIRQVQDGNPSSQQAGWEQLCTQYWKPVYVWLRARGSEPEDAEDLAQTFFSRLIAGDRQQIGTDIMPLGGGAGAGAVLLPFLAAAMVVPPLTMLANSGTIVTPRRADAAAEKLRSHAPVKNWGDLVSRPTR